MKAQFSTAWNSSKQPRKQRKYVHNAPLHTRHNFLNAHVAKTLRKEYGRSVPLRLGDEVKVMRGNFAGKKGKISKVDTKMTKILIEGITRSKRDGTKVPVGFHPSVLLIESFATGDQKRFKHKGEKHASDKSKH